MSVYIIWLKTKNPAPLNEGRKTNISKK